MNARERVSSVEHVHPLELAPLGIGLVALLAASVLGWNPEVVAVVVSPPLFLRIALAIAAVVVALMLLGGAVARMEGRTGSDGHLATLLRGIRLAFLAVASMSVASGWALGSGLPFLVALVIAGVDVVETSFLLLVVRRGSR